MKEITYEGEKMREIRVAYSKINNAGDLLNEYLLERVFSVPYVRDVSAWTLEMTGIGSFLDILLKLRT